MPFNATNWIAEAVRTSQYIVPEQAPDYGVLTASAAEIAASLAAVTNTPIDSQANAALLPARIPVDVPVPAALEKNFSDVVSILASDCRSLHPAVRHALLAVALHGDDADLKNQRLDTLWPLFDCTMDGAIYQPTMTWISLLRPQWFSPEIPVTPSARGGHEALKEEQGTLTTVALTQGKIRVNPFNMFSWALPIKLIESKQMSAPETWAKAADEAWGLPHPPVTSLWLMAFGDKNAFWSFVPPGAALFSPFYSDGEVDALVHNHVQHTDVGYFFRAGTGISDIFPLKDDPVLSCQFNVAPLFDAPLSFSTLTALGNLIAHPGAPTALPEEWAVRANQQCALADNLDLMPVYSAFSAVTIDGAPADSTARHALSKLAHDNHISHFSDLLHAVALAQEKSTKAFAANPIDAGVIGIPIDSFTWPVGSSIRTMIPPAVTAVLDMESV